MQYLPSKKFFIIVLSLALVFGCVFGFFSWKKRSDLENEKIALQKITKYAVSNANVDSDGDGLLDWEEAKIGTNPYKADTDGDGTPDGQEIAERRDPLVPGPNDFITAISTSTQPSLSSAQDLTETEKMMRTILTVATKDTQNDLNFPKVVATNIVSTINEKSADLPTVYTANNIKTVAETEASLKQYGNNLGAIFKKYDTQSFEQQKILYMLALSLKTNSDSSFSVFITLENARTQQIKSLAKVSVPKEMVSFHVSLLNNLSNMVLAMKNMQYMISDPARGLIGMKQYRSVSTAFNTTMTAITDHFDNSGVVFAKSDDGSFLYTPVSN